MSATSRATPAVSARTPLTSRSISSSIVRRRRRAGGGDRFGRLARSRANQRGELGRRRRPENVGGPVKQQAREAGEAGGRSHKFLPALDSGRGTAAEGSGGGERTRGTLTCLIPARWSP